MFLYKLFFCDLFQPTTRSGQGVGSEVRNSTEARRHVHEEGEKYYMLTDRTKHALMLSLHLLKLEVDWAKHTDYHSLHHFYICALQLSPKVGGYDSVWKVKPACCISFQDESIVIDPSVYCVHSTVYRVVRPQALKLVSRCIVFDDFGACVHLSHHNSSHVPRHWGWWLHHIRSWYFQASLAKTFDGN